METFILTQFFLFSWPRKTKKHGVICALLRVIYLFFHDLWEKPHLLGLRALLLLGAAEGGISLSLAPPPVLRLAQAFSLGGGAGIAFSGSPPWLEEGDGHAGEIGSSSCPLKTSFSECSPSWLLDPEHHRYRSISNFVTTVRTFFFCRHICFYDF